MGKRLVLLQLIAASVWGQVASFFRDSSPLFDDSLVIKQLTDDSFNAMLKATDEVWLVDFYSPLCPHCRHFAPEWETIATFYDKSKIIHVGAVDCLKNDQTCTREVIEAYPCIKLFHVPSTSTEGIKLTHHDKRNVQGVIGWVDDLMKEADMKTDLLIVDLEKQLENIKNGSIINDETVEQADSLGTKYGRLRDAGSAFGFIVEHSIFMGVDTLRGDRYQAAVKFINAVAQTFPFEQNRNVIQDLLVIVQQSNSWDKLAWSSMIEKWKTYSIEHTFPKQLLAADEQDGWVYCKTFTCGLWTLLHTISVGCDPTRVVKPSELADAVRGFVKYFFGCDDCVRHFLRANPPSVMTAMAEHDDDGGQTVAIWLWKMHNKVNKVTHHAFWPSVTACESCYAKDTETPSFDPAVLHEDEIFKYVQHIYHFQESDMKDFGQGGQLNSILLGNEWTSGSSVLIVFILLSLVGFLLRSHHMGKQAAKLQ